MNDRDQKKTALEAQISEAARLGDAIAERQAAAERFISVAGALSGVGFTLGLTQKQDLILVGLPLGLGIIILYMIQIYTDAGVLSGYRGALEARISERLHQSALVGQQVAAPHARRLSIILSPVLLGVVWLGTVFVGYRALCRWQQLSDDWRAPSIAIYVGLMIAVVGIIVVASWENTHAEEKARIIAEKAWNEPRWT